MTPAGVSFRQLYKARADQPEPPYLVWSWSHGADIGRVWKVPGPHGGYRWVARPSGGPVSALRHRTRADAARELARHFEDGFDAAAFAAIKAATKNAKGGAR